MRRSAGLVLGAGLLAAEVYFGRHAISSALTALRSASVGWVIVGVASTLISMQCFARSQRYLLRSVAADTLFSLRRMVRLTYIANALSTTMPAGGPISIIYLLRQFRSSGLSYAAAGFALVASGLLSSVTFVGLIAACGVASGRIDAVVAVAVIAVLALVLAYGARHVRRLQLTNVIAALVRRLGRLLSRVSSIGAEALETASDELEAIHPRQRDWAGAAGFAACNWVADVGSLAAASRAIPGGAHIGLVAVLTAFLAGMSASSIAVLPGGLGVVEVAMIVALHASGLPTSTATAVVLLYRLISCVFVVAIGWTALAAATAAEFGPNQLRGRPRAKNPACAIPAPPPSGCRSRQAVHANQLPSRRS